MTLTVFDQITQGSEAWHDQRRGILTASVVGQLITVGSPDALTVQCAKCGAMAGNPCRSLSSKERPPIKTIHDVRSSVAATKPSTYSVANNDTSRGLTATLVAERITGWTEPTFQNADMFRGVMDEPVARDLYAEHFATETVTETGFMVLEDQGFRLGFSPDGLVGTDGLIEVKSRRQKKQLTTVLSGEVPAENVAQIQCGLLVSGRKWCDYISFSGGMHLWVVRVYPDADWFAAITRAASAFEATAEQMVSDYLAAVDGLPLTERNDYLLDVI